MTRTPDTDASVDAVPLRERTAQLDLLESSLAVVAESRRGHAVVVHGEAGVGKTTLARHFCANTSTAGQVLWGRCDELLTPRPLARCSTSPMRWAVSWPSSSARTGRRTTSHRR